MGPGPRRRSCKGAGVRFARPPQPPAEATIAGAYDDIDRALQSHKAGSRRLSVIILVLGLIAVAAAVYLSPDRRRRREADRLPMRADTAVVLSSLGQKPTRCPAGGLDHLRAELTGLGGVQADSVMTQLRRDTRGRWIYPGRHGCTPDAGETEVGIDSAGRLLWIQPSAQHGEVKLSPVISY